MAAHGTGEPGAVMTSRAFPRATFSTERLLLRPFTPGDATEVHAVWNDDLYMRFVPADFSSAGSSLEHAVRWCTHGMEEWRRLGQGVGFAAEEQATGRLAGHVALFGTDWQGMTTEIHYWTAPWGRGKGYATEAVRMVARRAITEHGFARVALAAVITNKASRRVAEAAGFRLEGILRNAALTRAGREDLSVYSLIPRDLPGFRA